MKRLLKYLLAGIAAFVVVAALAVWFALSSMIPLEDGAQIGRGAVTVVVDKSTGPVPTAAYLFQLQDGGFGLIDATQDPEAEAIRAALARLGKRREDVRAILFTHSHGDHTAGARAFPNAEQYILEPDTAMREGPGSVLNRFQKLFPASRGPAPARLAITRRLSDGEHLDLHGTPVEVFALPGHTADSAAFLVHGVLFLGDSAGAHSGGGIGAAPPFLSADRERNQQELLELADRLRDRCGEISHMAFGHQGPLEGLDALLKWGRATSK